MQIPERYQQLFSEDEKLSAQARFIFPDGINSDSRYMLPHPVYVDRASGSKKWTVGGQELIDYWAGHGALLFGHNPPEIVAAVIDQIQKGVHFGACHPLEIEWGKLVQDLIPSAELVRFTSSGTEANQQAVQLARTFTGKNKLLAFEGHYHGWLYPVFPTVILAPNGQADDRIICPTHDIEAVEQQLKNDPDIACIILEPTGACSGVVPIDGLFLQRLRALCTQYGVLLIFDEIITGFRVSPGGAQAYYKVSPDLTTLGKILTGGLSGGAICGRKEILQLISFDERLRGNNREKIAHYGTFSANPLSAAAGIAMLKLIHTQAPYEAINTMAATLRLELNQLFTHYKLDWVAYGEFSCIKFLFGHGHIGLYANEFDARQWDYKKLLSRGNREVSRLVHQQLLIEGIDISLSSVLSAAHTSKDLSHTIASFEKTIHSFFKIRTIHD